ncbi:MAG: hypothetical protein HN961_04600 [Planctomycetes bacterium]|nr:hypothetical protein [Planctomycetota bacterium]
MPDSASSQDSEVSSKPAWNDTDLTAKVRTIMKKVQGIRKWKFTEMVGAGVQSPDEFLVFARKEFEEEYGEEKFAAWSEAYGMLGLIKPGTDLLEAYMTLLRSQVGGYYDPKTKTFYMMDTFPPGAMADVIMAHELTHALDDQVHGLEQMMSIAEGNSDTEFAVRAVAEGSGTSLMNLYTVRGVQGGFLDMNELQETMMHQMETQGAMLREAPPYLVMTLSLPYLEGNKFLTQQSNIVMASMAAPTNDDLNHAFQNPPVSSEQILHFEKYWDPKKRDDPKVVDLSDVSASLGEGWKLVEQDTLGELGCFCVTTTEFADLSTQEGQMNGIWTNDAATGWGGDRWYFYKGPDEQAFIVWGTIWDSAKDATEFAAAMRGMSEHQPSQRHIGAMGSSVFVYYANDAAADGLMDFRKAVLAELAKPQ